MADIHGGRKVGKYETLALLSMGGMAELFLAYTAGPGGFRKFVALKQILPDIKKDESFRTMFLDEARITAAFSHSNIAQVFDLGEEDGELYLAMEFIAGQNLEQVVKLCKKKEVQLPLGFAAMAVRDTCLALHYAHHFVDPSGRPAPVIHRDVSPKNVMMTYDGNIKVVDFGIAKAKGRINRTRVGMVKGTTSYMSPEQIRNEQLDGRSDLFSAGVMLHELLTGRRLFDGPSDPATMMQIVEEDAPPPRSFNPAIPAALDEVVVKALSRKRDARFSTGKEMARAIDAAFGGETFDEDDAAAFMQELFADKVKKTRAMLDMASRDDHNLSAAADQLRDEGDGSAASGRGTPGGRGTPRGAKDGARAAALRESGPRLPRPSQKTPPPRTSQRTPTPRGADGADGAPRMPSGKYPRPPPAKRPPPRPAPTPDTDELTNPPQSKWASSVAKEFSLYSDQDAETAPRPQVAASSNATSVRPAIKRPADAKPRRAPWGTIFFLLLVGGLGAGGYYAVNDDGPMGDLVRPYYAAAKEWVNKEFAGEPPPPPDQPIVPTQPPGAPPSGAPPAFAVPSAAESAPPVGQSDSPAATAAIASPQGAASNEPVGRSDKSAKAAGVGSSDRPAATAQQAVGQSDRSAAKAQEKATDTRPAAAASGAGVKSPQKRVPPRTEDGSAKPPSSEPAEGKVAAVPVGVAAKPAATKAPVEASAGAAAPVDQPVTTVTQGPDEVEVLNTRSARGAEEDGLGWVTLYTVPPVWVWDGATKLGTTPLIKMPLPAGTYRLRLTDPDSKYRVLSVPIKAGKVTELKIRVADLPLDPNQD